MFNRKYLGYSLPAFFIGGLVGAVVMALFAPRSGHEIRGLIARKSMEIRDQLVSTAGDTTRMTGKMVGDLTQQARDTAGAILHRGRVTAEGFKSNVEEEAKSKSVQFGS